MFFMGPTRCQVLNGQIAPRRDVVGSGSLTPVVRRENGQEPLCCRLEAPTEVLSGAQASVSLGGISAGRRLTTVRVLEH